MNKISIFLLAVAATTAYAQSQTEPVFRSQTRAIQINLVAKDAGGHAVRDLKKSDFVLTDNGKPREIRFFSVDDGVPPPSKAADLPKGFFSNRFGTANMPPLATALILNGGTIFQAYVREQLVKAIGEMHQGDTVAIYSLWQPTNAPPCCPGPQFRTIQDYTTDLKQAVRSVMADKLSGTAVPPLPDSFFWLRTIASRLVSVPGRKRIVWLGGSFGAPRSWGSSYDVTADLIARANIAVYLIYVPPMVGGLGLEPSVLAYYGEIAKGFGGQVKQAGNDFHEAIRQALEDPVYVYQMGFYLPPNEADGKTHNLNVSVVGQPKLELNYRSEYGAKPDPDVPLASPDPTSALLSPVDLTDLGIDATVSPAQTKDGRAVRVTIVLDPATIKRQRDGTAKLEEVFAEKNSDGGYVARIEDKVKLTWPEAQPIGRYERTIPVRPGAVSLRVVVRDSATGRIGSLTIPIN